jgi:hypothetical protein
MRNFKYSNLKDIFLRNRISRKAFRIHTAFLSHNTYIYDLAEVLFWYRALLLFQINNGFMVSL